MKEIKIFHDFIIFFLLFNLSSSSLFVSEEDMKKHMQAIYGENKEIVGDYNKDLSVQCNNGIFVGKLKNDVLSFKGIPYAKPPIDDLRWKDPILAEDSDKIYEAYYFGKSPLQREYKTQYGSYYPKSENCLYLNVWVNTKDSSTNKPVLVFIHGGNYIGGATSSPIFDGHNLIEKYPDIIFVSIGYRLGLLGFIDFSTVPGGENYKNSAILGFLDQICALKWIQKNIKKFGGDPNKITLLGNSSGGSSVSMLPLIKGSEGLFKRIISQSGPLSLSFSPEESEILTKKFLKKSGSSNMDDLIALSEEEMLEYCEDIDNYNYPVRDGINLPINLYEAYKSEKLKNIDLLIGTTLDEARYWCVSRGEIIFRFIMPVVYENNYQKLTYEDKQKLEEFMKLQNDYEIWKITEFYNEVVFRVPIHKMAEYHSNAGGNTYVYQWRYPGENQRMGAFHNIEISYILNNLEEIFYTGNKVNIKLANKVQDMWINFVRTGNPSTSEYSWEQYNSDTRKIMILDEKIEMIEDYQSEERELIEPLIKYYFNINVYNLSYNVPFVYKTIALVVCSLFLIKGIFNWIRNSH